MGKIKPGRKTASVHIGPNYLMTLERHIKEQQVKENQEARNDGTIKPRHYGIKDAMRMALLIGLNEMESRHQHADRMAAKRVLGHMWCKHLDVCGGVLTAPGEEAQRAHLQRDHSTFYTSEMSAAEVASHFKPMSDDE